MWYSIRRAEESGVIFLDEIDKLCNDHSVARGSYGDVKGEGVQKELLGLIEWTSVNTDLDFTDDAIKELASMSKKLNESVDNIASRRLRAVISN